VGSALTFAHGIPFSRCDLGVEGCSGGTGEVFFGVGVSGGRCWLWVGGGVGGVWGEHNSRKIFFHTYLFSGVCL